MRHDSVRSAVKKTAGALNISAAAAVTGLSAKMIRHYETLGLVGEVARTESDYRQYQPANIQALLFIKRARSFGFSVADIATLMHLWHDPERASANVKQIAQNHVNTLQQRIAQMQEMQRNLETLIQCCHGDTRADCSILDQLAHTSRRAE